jgi:hypothetical protein
LIWATSSRSTVLRVSLLSRIARFSSSLMRILSAESMLCWLPAIFVPDNIAILTEIAGEGTDGASAYKQVIPYNMKTTRADIAARLLHISWVKYPN